MTSPNDKLAKLAIAQAAVEKAERDKGIANIAAMLFISDAEPFGDINSQRAESVAPAEETLRAAIAERDRCLKELGWSLEEWLQKWENAKAQAAAVAQT